MSAPRGGFEERERLERAEAAEVLERGHDRALFKMLLGGRPPWVLDFDNPSHEWRRLFAELFGTFLLVLAGAGAPVVDAFSHGAISRSAAVVAPALTVMAVILFMGAVSGAHLNPVVSLAFALRREFPWRRIPLYVIAQLAGAVLACEVLRSLFGAVGHLGATLPAHDLSDPKAAVVEALLTLGLVSTILGTASGAQNVGSLSAVAVAGYIALAGLWSSPLTGASMNPARSFGPEAVLGDFSHLWVYVVGPAAGALLAVGAAIVLRGAGGDPAATRAAQGAVADVLSSASTRLRRAAGAGEPAQSAPSATGRDGSADHSENEPG